MSERAIRWIRPAWLHWDQAVIYSGLPVYVLRGLISNRLVRARTFAGRGKLIQRESIDEILSVSVVSRQPVFWGQGKLKQK